MAKIPKPAQLNAVIATPAQAEGVPEDSILWAPQAGPQTMAMLRDEFEIFYGGAKGGGKSFSIIGWLIKGNPDVPLSKATPLDISYVNCPTYRALVVRKNFDDLNSWIAEANQVYSKLGAMYTHKPNEFTFPSGAKIVMGHLDDDKAVEKYFGNVVHRAAIDELTFIDSFRNYMRLVSCVRSNVKGVRAQVFATGNPGGPGTPWVMDRFVEPKDDAGEVIPPLTTITQRIWNPYTKQEEAKTRIFIPSKLGDNPKLLQTDPGYYTTLAMMPDAERRAYLDGDWHSLGGLFFPDFRPKKRESEPAEACHVIPTESRGQAPWLPVFAACDWGFGHNAAVGGAKRDVNGQTIIHREFVSTGVGSVDLGNQIARMFLPDLNALKSAGVKPTITLWLSPDAFGKRDEHKTPAEGIAEGIGRVLGPNAVHLPDLFQPTPAAYPQTELSLLRDVEFQAESGIVIRRAQNARVAGASHLREMLRWRQITVAPQEKFDSILAAKLLHESWEKHLRYVEAFKRRTPESLPKLLIEEQCKHVIQAFQAVVSDPKNIEDILKTEAVSDDVIDMIRYLLHSQNVADNREPKQSFVQRHMNTYTPSEGASMNDKVFMAMKAAEDYAAGDEDLTPFRVRASSGHRIQ